jgi:hypothetical protein
VLKKLLTSQETYIKELENKSGKLENDLKMMQINMTQDQSQNKAKVQHSEWDVEHSHEVNLQSKI